MITLSVLDVPPATTGRQVNTRNSGSPVCGEDFEAHVDDAPVPQDPPAPEGTFPEPVAVPEAALQPPFFHAARGDADESMEVSGKQGAPAEANDSHPAPTPPVQQSVAETQTASAAIIATAASRPEETPPPADQAGEGEAESLSAEDGVEIRIEKPSAQTGTQTSGGDDSSPNAAPPQPAGDLADQDPGSSGNTDPDLSTLPVGASGTTQTGPSMAAQPAPHPVASAISRQLAEAAGGSTEGRVELTLSPEELGRVRMVLHSDDSALNITIQADRQDTLDLMRRNIDSLLQEFRDAGYAEIAFEFQSGAEGNPDSRGEGTPQFEPAEFADATSTPQHRSESSGRLDLRF